MFGEIGRVFCRIELDLHRHAIAGLTTLLKRFCIYKYRISPVGVLWRN